MSAHSNSLVLCYVARIAHETERAFLVVDNEVCTNLVCEGCPKCADRETWVARNIKDQQCSIHDDGKVSGNVIIEVPRWLARKNGWEVIN